MARRCPKTCADRHDWFLITVKHNPPCDDDDVNNGNDGDDDHGGDDDDGDKSTTAPKTRTSTSAWPN